MQIMRMHEAKKRDARRTFRELVVDDLPDTIVPLAKAGYVSDTSCVDEVRCNGWCRFQDAASGLRQGGGDLFLMLC